MNDFQGKTVLITGGNSGIGYATAVELRNRGANVVITGRRREAIETTAKELHVIGKVADQSNIEAIEQLAVEIGEEFGEIDILFINAGVTAKAAIDKATPALWHQVVDVNLTGAYFTLSRFIPLLKEGGSVVFLSSVIATRTIAGSSLYALSKAAINSVVKTAALELAPKRIRVNAVSPGPTETGVFTKMGLDEITMQNVKSSLQNKIPLGTLGDAADVAKMVAYLCTNNARFITGSEFTLDGGMTLC